MKIRKGFVSNSSSSSFVIISAGNIPIAADGDDTLESCGEFDMQIDELIDRLQKAKEAGETVVTVTHGGGYEG